MKIYNQNKFKVSPALQDLLRTRFFEQTEITLDIVNNEDREFVPVRNKRGYLLCHIDTINDQIL